ncbi:hypothetical protein Tco_1140962, partial [Tanacetum coccineum]
MLEALGPSEATSKALYQSTSNVEKTVGQSKCKKGKRTDGKLLVVDKGKKAQRSSPFRDCILGIRVVALYGKEILQTRR